MSQRWVLITRAFHEVEELARELQPHVKLVAYPVLQLKPWFSSPSWEEVKKQVANINLLVFTSGKAPALFLKQAKERGLAETLRQLPVAAVGDATASSCLKVGLCPVIKGDSTGSQLGKLIVDRFPGPLVVLFPCGRQHREELETELTQKGVKVLPLPVYAMEPTPVDELPELPQGLPAAVVVTSPRAGAHYWQTTGGRYGSVPHLAFGPTTAAELQRFGVTAQPLSHPNQDSLREELCRI